MATDPGQLTVLLRDLADGAVPQYRAALGEAVGEVRSRATLAADAATASRAVADRAAGLAEDQRRAVAEVAARVAEEDGRRIELQNRARHAVEYAERTVDVVDGLRRQWEQELVAAHSLVAELRERIERGGRVGEDARHRFPAALERQRCCSTAVERCREAAGIAAGALRQARQATALVAQYDDTVARAAECSGDAAGRAGEAEAAAEQGRYTALAAEDAGVRIHALAGDASEQADAGADLLSEVGLRATTAAEALTAFDRGGLR